MVKIDDPQVIATRGKTRHPVVAFTGRDADTVAGTVFQITPEELQNADEYEVAAYKRIAVTLRSGARAWVYVDARYTPPA